MDGIFGLSAGRQTEDYIVLADHKTQNTSGGTFTSGAWRTRDINTVKVDTGGHCSILSNQIKLRAGTYRYALHVPACGVTRNQLRLQNISRGLPLPGYGESNSSYSINYGYSIATLFGRACLSEPTVLEIQHQCESTSGTYGFGVEANFSTEVYAQAEFWRECPTNADTTKRMRHIVLADEKTQNTSGGTFTSGAWRTRDINVLRHDTGGDCSLSTNQIRLRAGTYRVRVTTHGYSCDRHQARLQNITTGTTAILGNSALGYTVGNVFSGSVIIGRVTLASTQIFEIQHQCQTTCPTYGYGVEGNFGTEVYTLAEFFKE